MGIQREIRGTILEARYVGNHSTKMFRAYNLNPVELRANGFLEDFVRARSNGNLARQIRSGKLSEQDRDAALSRIRAVPAYEGFAAILRPLLDSAWSGLTRAAEAPPHD